MCVPSSFKHQNGWQWPAVLIGVFFMPLVLVQNPVKVNADYDWKDIEGERYHFPNQYKNRCAPGTPFIYYRGTRRADGTRGMPQYFGYGRIGDVWRDESIPESEPKKDWAWYCSIEDYVPFAGPVASKLNGNFIEQIARNHWSVGVRPLSLDLYGKILSLAGCAPPLAPDQPGPLPDFGTLTITEATGDLLIPRRPVAARGQGIEGDGNARYSRNAARIGNRAEEVAHKYIMDNATVLGAKNIRWVAKQGLTPGWDMQYEDQGGNVIAVEVKGSAGPRFANIDITAGEWKAANERGSRYWIYLVAGCCGTTPTIQRLQNPASLVANGGADLGPFVFRFAALSHLRGLRYARILRIQPVLSAPWGGTEGICRLLSPDLRASVQKRMTSGSAPSPSLRSMLAPWTKAQTTRARRAGSS